MIRLITTLFGALWITLLFGSIVLIAAELINDGFESGDTSEWDGSFIETGNSLSVSMDETYLGTYALKVEIGTSNDDARLFANVPAISEIYVRGMFYIPNERAGTSATWFLGTSDTTTGSVDLALGVRTVGSNINHLWFFNPDVGATDTGTALAIETWYCVELHYEADADGPFEVWLDGAALYSEADDISSEVDQDVILIGHDGVTGTAQTWYIDEVIYDDAERVGCPVQADAKSFVQWW